MEKVTLYIPCFNTEKTINECLDSVLKQTYPIDEILIIDDGCQDRTPDIISGYPVKVIKHGKNKGLAASRNTAFKQASNEFVASLDADCAAYSDWLKQLMDCFSEEEVSGVGGILIERYTDSAANKWRALHMPQMWGEESIDNPPFLYGSNTVFKKKAVESIGMYNEIFRNNYEDVGLSILLYDKGFKLMYNPKAIVEHLRKDTIVSVLSAHWRWKYYRNIRIPEVNNLHYRMAFRLGNVFDFNDDVSCILRQDWQDRDYRLVFIDLIAIFYSPWLTVKHFLQRLIFRIGEIWKIPVL